MKKIEQIVSNNDNDILAIIIYADYSSEGVNFFTPNEFSQQLAYMKHPSGKKIQPHIHNEITRNVMLTQEVLVIKSGTIQVDLYDNQRKFVVSKLLTAGDIILLASGGHGFEVIEDVEMIEIKQGPYAGDMDKTRF